MSKQRLQAVLLLQAVGDAEDAAEIADILAEHQHIGIALQHHVERRVQGLDHASSPPCSDPQFPALLDDAPIGRFEHAFEHFATPAAWT